MFLLSLVICWFPFPYNERKGRLYQIALQVLSLLVIILFFFENNNSFYGYEKVLESPGNVQTFGVLWNAFT